MHARVTTVKLRPEKVGDSVSLYGESVVPAARQQAGFRGILLLSDPASGKALSIALWDSEAAMLAGEASGYLGAQLAKFGEWLTEAPVVEHYEVSIQV